MMDAWLIDKPAIDALNERVTRQDCAAVAEASSGITAMGLTIDIIRMEVTNALELLSMGEPTERVDAHWARRGALPALDRIDRVLETLRAKIEAEKAAPND